MSSQNAVLNPADTGEKKTYYRWVVLGLIFLVYTIANADRANIGIALPFVRKDIPMTNEEAGRIISMFYLTYAFCMIPAGFLIAKLGVRKIFSFGMLATSLATGAFGFAGSVMQMKLMRLCVGIAEAPIAVCLSTTINNWFPRREKGIATSIFIASSKFGPLLVPPLCGAIIHFFGWRYVFWICAIPGILLAFVWIFAVNNSPSKSRFVSKAEAEHIKDDSVDGMAAKDKKPVRPYTFWRLDKFIRARQMERLDTTKKLFTSWNMIGNALGYFFIIGIISIMMTWVPSYLINVKKMEIMSMAMVAAAPFLGTVLGNLVGGYVSDRILGQRRKPLMLLTALLTSGMLYSLVYAPESPLIVGGLLFLTGFVLALGFSNFVAYPMNLVSQQKFPIATAICNTGGQLGGAATPWLVGIILDKYDWDMVFIMLSVGCLVCFLLVMSIVEPVKEVVTREVAEQRKRDLASAA